ncbi:MAG: hypothetical protein U0L45_08525 [Alistipes sp.]|nr:hypothetical protein [Alistipes sp.]
MRVIKAIFATFVVVLLAMGCVPKSRYVTVEGYMLGTTFRVVANTTLKQSEIYDEQCILIRLQSPQCQYLTPIHW